MANNLRLLRTNYFLFEFFKAKPVEIPESGSYGSSLGPKPSEGDSNCK